ncbi:MAG: hypothetical protein IT564_11475 [Rhodospirillales bacterium]|nr:hypothetical protein [Rhodospirillales bacterium]
MNKTCQNCRFWKGSESSYLGECGHANGMGRMAFDASCKGFETRRISVDVVNGSPIGTAVDSQRIHINSNADPTKWTYSNHGPYAMPNPWPSVSPPPPPPDPSALPVPNAFHDAFRKAIHKVRIFSDDDTIAQFKAVTAELDRELKKALVEIANTPSSSDTYLRDESPIAHCRALFEEQSRLFLAIFLENHP